MDRRTTFRMSPNPELKHLPEVAASEPLPVQSGGFFAKHWRGDYSLPRSYWLHGGVFFGIGVNMIIFSVLMGVMFAFREQRAITIIVGLGEVALLVAAYIWALVGTWRAAGKYKGLKLWAILARIGMGLGVLISIPRVLTTIGFVIDGFPSY